MLLKYILYSDSEDVRQEALFRRRRRRMTECMFRTRRSAIPNHADTHRTLTPNLHSVPCWRTNLFVEHLSLAWAYNDKVFGGRPNRCVCRRRCRRSHRICQTCSIYFQFTFRIYGNQTTLSTPCRFVRPFRGPIRDHIAVREW